MSEAGHRRGWEGVSGDPTVFDAYSEMVNLALNRALINPGGEPTRDGFTVVSARVDLGAPSSRRNPGAVVVLSEALVKPTAATAGDVARYQGHVAAIQAGRPGVIKCAVAKEIRFDGQGTRLSVSTKRDRRYAGEGQAIRFDIEFIRAFMSSDGIRLFKQIQSGHSSEDGVIKLLGWDRAMFYSALSKDMFKGTETKSGPGSKPWVEEIALRFDPTPGVEVLEVDDWQSLFNEPLNTTHILRNRGRGVDMPKIPEGQTQYRWADKRDIGTEEGEMSVDDVLGLAQSVIEDAGGSGQNPVPEGFTLRGAHEPTFGRSLWLGETKNWSATADKSVSTEDGYANLEVRSSHQDNGKVGGQDRYARFTFSRSIGSGLVVIHELSAQRTSNKGKVILLFDNTYEFWRRQPDGGLWRCKKVPSEVADLISQHPDLLASLTYDKWSELIRRQLTEEDIITRT